ncbi:MAG: hypothetical protein ABI358_06065, partial [Ginsengibacter sp.]
DAEFKTHFFSFMQVYLKAKYSEETLTDADKSLIKNFFAPFHKRVKEQVPLRQRFAKFLNFYSTLNFFSKQKI